MSAELTAAEWAYLRSRVDELPDGVVLAAARKFSDVKQGYRVEAKSVAQFRKRLKNKIRQALPVPPDMRELLQVESLQSKLFSVLSVEALAYAQAEFLQYFGSVELKANWYLDNREAVRELAAKITEEVEPPATEARAAIAEALIHQFEPFGEVTSELLQTAWGDDEDEGEGEALKAAEGAVADESAGGAVREELERKVERLESELEASRETAKRRKERLAAADREHREALNRLSAEIKVKTDEAQQANARAYVQEQQFQGEIAGLKEELKVQGERFEAEVAKQLREELQLERNRWLLRPMKLEKLADAVISSADLRERVGAVLRQQGKMDKQYGTVRELEARRAELLEAQHQLRVAQQNARQVHPELTGLLNEIGKKLGEINAELPLLSTDEVESAGYWAALRRARTEAELAKVFSVIRQAAELGAILPHGLEQLDEVRQIRLTEIRAEEAVGKTPVAASVAEKTKTPKAREGFLGLIDRKEPVFVLVDGHNALLNMPRYQKTLESGNPGAKARDSLAEGFVQLTFGAKTGEIRIFFDSPQANEVQASEIVRLIYSGGSGKNRADDRMVAYLQHVRSESAGIPCFVITNDKEIARDAREVHAEVISLEEFEGLLGKYLVK